MCYARVAVISSPEAVNPVTPWPTGVSICSSTPGQATRKAPVAKSSSAELEISNDDTESDSYTVTSNSVDAPPGMTMFTNDRSNGVSANACWANPASPNSPPPWAESDAMDALRVCW